MWFSFGVSRRLFKVRTEAVGPIMSFRTVRGGQGNPSVLLGPFHSSVQYTCCCIVVFGGCCLLRASVTNNEPCVCKTSPVRERTWVLDPWGLWAR